MIPQRNISLIANKLVTAEGRRIPEAVIERDYVLAWFLTGLSEHALRDVLAFKGGTALRRRWFEDYRFSEDLDFTLIRPITLKEILAGLDEIFVAIKTQTGLQMAFDHEDRHGHHNCHTFYLRYEGPLPAPNDVKVDITINETLCFSLQDRPVLRTYEYFDDLPEGPTIKVYALEEITIEKLLALSDNARNEPRDLYDLWFLLNSTGIQLADMHTEIETKLKFRKRPIEGIEQAVAAKEKLLSRLWNTRLSHHMNDLPPCDRVLREVLRGIRAAGLPK